MVLSKREKYIAIGAAAAVGLLVLNAVAITPYFEALKQVENERDAIRKQDDDALATFARSKQLRGVWTELQRGGLMVDPSMAESQSQQAILDWAKNANVEVASVRPERPTAWQKFQIINFSVTGAGSLNSISKLLWSFETAKIPVRITEMTINPKREGTDDLTVRFGISMLCMPPGGDRNSTPVNSGAAPVSTPTADTGGGA